MEDLNGSLDGTDGSHALAAGFEARSGGQSGGAGDVETAMAADAASSGKGRPPLLSIIGNISRSNTSISRGTSESSPRISHSNTSINRGTSDSSLRARVWVRKTRVRCKGYCAAPG